ncbi:uncharacterized protein TM35_000471510 [Trypanosoma theileri]|uniref:Mucin-like glycoprotein n=1 Tax=Trypanosoma theileri TaxID=67003 RepID=A0A1X0NHU9_9TRYP|nr:uncharacterized protein TM35_000471510 [Trypanosoma theileri]ORC84256.1 hypothetical protein TM35_000471510 [Trypanosoma theileri]
MMMMIRRVMCVLAVVLCCACGSTVTSAATNGQPKAVTASGQENSEDDVFVFHDKANLPKGYNWNTDWHWNVTLQEQKVRAVCKENASAVIAGKNCSEWLKSLDKPSSTISGEDSHPGGGSGDGSELQDAHVKEGSQERGPESSEDPDGAPEVKGKKPGTESRATGTVTSTPIHTPGTPAGTQGDQVESSSTGDNGTPADSNPNQRSRANVDGPAAPESQETNSTTQPSTENTTTEAPTPTPSSVPNAEINNITSNVENKANVDSSISPVWMRTAAPLLIVAVLVSVAVY